MPADSYPLSPIQQGMLFHWLLDPRSGNNVEQVVVELPEPIDPRALALAWQHVVERCSVLRTAFRWEGLPAPEQYIQQVAAVPFRHEDLRSLPGLSREAHVAAFLRSDRREGFDLAAAPALRVTLFQLADADFRMIWTVHHILVDGRSIELVLAAVFERLAGGPSDGALDRPYRDYTMWVTLRDGVGPRLFWRGYLDGVIAPTPLPHDRPAVSEGDSFARLHVELPAPSTRGLRDLAAREGLSLHALLLGAWALLLSRHSGVSDVVFGATRSTRLGTTPGAEDAIGLFLATVPVRIEVDPTLKVVEWLHRVQHSWDSIHGNEHLPLVDIKQLTALPAAAPLFETLLMFEDSQAGTRLRTRGGRWADRRCTLLEQPGLPIALSVFGDDALALTLDYDGRRFEDESISRMLGHFTTILATWASGIDGTVGQVPMLTDAERHTLLVEWNQTASPYPRDRPLAELIEQQVRVDPAQVALTFEDQHLTYGELNARANRLAHQLIRLGVGPDSLVGVCLPRSPDLVVALVAVVKSGGAYVPLDPGLPLERLSYMAGDAGLAALVTTGPFDQWFDGPAPHILLAADDRGDGPDSGNPGVAVAPEHLAYVIYTSGSTGRPKGVEVTRGGFLNLIWSMGNIPGMAASDSVLALTTVSFDISGVELMMPLAVGARIILASHETALDPYALQALIRRTSPTIMQATPVTFRMLFDAGWPGDSRVKAICGGEAIPLELGNALAATCREAWNAYGPTETTVWSTFHRLRQDDAVIYIGRPIVNTTVYILDRQDGPVPQGATGELCIGGDGVARGYRNRPDLTAERFVPGPAGEATVIYRTGDLARRGFDGTIQCLGRVDQQVKIRGFRIEPGEIESLLSQRPEVRQAVVVAHEDHRGEHQLVAYVVADGESLDPAALRAHLRENLPEYMIPAAIVRLDVLPTTPNGKVDRRALPAPTAGSRGPARAVVAPRNHVERQLANIWEELFPEHGVGVDDDFWDLGGHSLMAVKMMGRIGQVFGKRLPLTTLYTSPTVARLAKHIEDHGNSDGRHTLVPLQASGSRKPVYWIPGGAALGLFSHQHIVEGLGPEQPIYGLGSAFPQSIGDLESVEERAARYLTLIRGVQPQGPYSFIGFCDGGIIAFEMAQQLLRAGERTALLGLINCALPGYPRGRLAGLRFKAQRLRHQLRQAREEGKGFLAYAREKLAARRANEIERRKVAERVERARQVGFTDSGSGDYDAVLDANTAVMARYRPAFYPGSATFFVSEETDYLGLSPDLDPRFALSRFVSTHEVYRLKGEHEAIFALAETLSAALQAALERAAPEAPADAV